MDIILVRLAFFLFFTMLVNWYGFDDVVYDYMGKKPRGDQAIKRIIFVFFKAVSSYYGGYATFFI
jgi:hypothetical protein